MQITSLESRQIPTLHQQFQRLNAILDIVVHLFPESSERFDYDEEILTLIFVARDLAQDMRGQCDEQTPLVLLEDPPPPDVTTNTI
jgi:hypothetical protein